MLFRSGDAVSSSAPVVFEAAKRAVIVEGLCLLMTGVVVLLFSVLVAVLLRAGIRGGTFDSKGDGFGIGFFGALSVGLFFVALSLFFNSFQCLYATDYNAALKIATDIGKVLK